MREKPSAQRGRAVVLGMFVVYLVLLMWIVLWKLEVPWVGEAALLPRPFKLVPFVPSGNAGPSAPLEVVANILLFVPFGFYLGVLAPSWRWWTPMTVFVGVSLVLEITEHLLSTGSFDTTDLIANAAGGLAGLGLLTLARRRSQGSTTAVMIRVSVVFTVLAVLAVVVFVVSPLHYGPQRDVIVPTPSSSA